MVFGSEKSDVLVISARRGHQCKEFECSTLVKTSEMIPHDGAQQNGIEKAELQGDGKQTELGVSESTILQSPQILSKNGFPDQNPEKWVERTLSRDAGKELDYPKQCIKGPSVNGLRENTIDKKGVEDLRSPKDTNVWQLQRLNGKDIMSKNQLNQAERPREDGEDKLVLQKLSEMSLLDSGKQNDAKEMATQDDGVRKKLSDLKDIDMQAQKLSQMTLLDDDKPSSPGEGGASPERGESSHDVAVAARNGMDKSENTIAKKPPLKDQACNGDSPAMKLSESRRILESETAPSQNSGISGSNRALPKLPQTSNHTLKSFLIPCPETQEDENSDSSEEDACNSLDDMVSAQVAERGPMMEDRLSQYRDHPYEKTPSPSSSSDTSSPGSSPRRISPPIQERGPTMHRPSRPIRVPYSTQQSQSSCSETSSPGTSPRPVSEATAVPLPQTAPQTIRYTNRHPSGSGGTCSVNRSAFQAERISTSASSVSPQQGAGFLLGSHQHMSGGRLMAASTSAGQQMPASTSCPPMPATILHVQTAPSSQPVMMSMQQVSLRGGPPVSSISSTRPSIPIAIVTAMPVQFQEAGSFLDYRGLPVNSPASVYSCESPAMDDMCAASPLPDSKAYAEPDPEASIMSPSACNTATLDILHLNEKDLPVDQFESDVACGGDSVTRLFNTYFNDMDFPDSRELPGMDPISLSSESFAPPLPPSLPFPQVAGNVLQVPACGSQPMPTYAVQAPVASSSPIAMPPPPNFSVNAASMAPVSPKRNKDLEVKRIVQMFKPILPRPPPAENPSPRPGRSVVCITPGPSQVGPTTSLHAAVRRPSQDAAPNQFCSVRERLKALLDPTKQSDCEVKVDSKIFDLFKTYGDGDTNLHISVANNDKELTYAIVEKLIRMHESIDLINFKKQTPLFLAVALNNKLLTEYLLYCGAAPSLACIDGSTPLHVVALKGPRFLEIGEVLCQSRNIHLNQRNSKGFTPLLLAVQQHSLTNDMIPFISMLLKYGAGLDFTDSCNDKTALHMAVERGQPELVKVICESCTQGTIDAAINLCCGNGYTALHFAAQLNSMDESIQTAIVNTLQHHGANCAVRCRSTNKYPKDLVCKQREKVRNSLRVTRK